MWIVGEYYKNDEDFRFAVANAKPELKKVIKLNSLRREYSWRVEEEGDVIYHLTKQQSIMIARWLDEKSRELLMDIVRNVNQPRECKLVYDAQDGESCIVCKTNEYGRQSITGFGEVIIPFVPMWAIIEENKRISIR